MKKKFVAFALFISAVVISVSSSGCMVRDGYGRGYHHDRYHNGYNNGGDHGHYHDNGYNHY